MRRLLLWLSPWTWVKVAASSLPLYVNAIQLSEVANEIGKPVKYHRGEWYDRAELVAFEGRQIRKHLGFLDE